MLCWFPHWPLEPQAQILPFLLTLVLYIKPMCLQLVCIHTAHVLPFQPACSESLLLICCPLSRLFQILDYSLSYWGINFFSFKGFYLLWSLESTLQDTDAVAVCSILYQNAFVFLIFEYDYGVCVCLCTCVHVGGICVNVCACVFLSIEVRGQPWVFVLVFHLIGERVFCGFLFHMPG